MISGLISKRPMEDQLSEGEGDSEIPNKKKKNIFVKEYDLNEDLKEKRYTNQTFQFSKITK